MIITDRDRCRLGNLLTRAERAATGTAHSRWDLEARIDDALPLPAERVSAQVVTMNSTLALVDLETGERWCVTLVYPEDQEWVPSSVSVLETLGRCLLGRSVGDVIEVPEGERVRRVLVASVLYQPEAAGDIHL